VLLFIVGMIKTIQISLQLAYQEFESALREVEPVEISNSQESEPVEEISNSQKTDDIESTPTIVAAVRDTRIRALRKEASQQGIRNASWMKKKIYSWHFRILSRLLTLTRFLMQAIKLADVQILAIRLEQVREEINLICDSEGDRIQPDEVECAIAYLLQMQLEDCRFQDEIQEWLDIAIAMSVRTQVLKYAP
jgi:hypothetical protein